MDKLLGHRAGFARRIIEIWAIKAREQRSGYVDLDLKRKTMAQIHPQPRQNGIALVLRSKGEDRSATKFVRIEVSDLWGHEGGSNISWLDGKGREAYEEKGPAIAFLIPDCADLWPATVSGRCPRGCRRDWLAQPCVLEIGDC